MQTPRAFWPAWAARLQRWNLTSFAAWLLEAGSPLTLLGAQALYFASPMIGGEQAQALARVLEEDEEVLALANFLREEASA
jgi:hypothetical protein